MGKVVNDSPSPPQQQQQQLLLHHSESSCSSCLWTGVLTSMGLSVYFAYIAFDDDDDVMKPNVTETTSMTVTPKNPTMLHQNKIIHSTTNSNYHSTGTSSHISRPTTTTWFQQQVQKLVQYPSSPPPPFVSRYNKPVFLCISAGWFMVGVYRWHLG